LGGKKKENGREMYAKIRVRGEGKRHKTMTQSGDDVLEPSGVVGGNQLDASPRDGVQTKRPGT